MAVYRSTMYYGLPLPTSLTGHRCKSEEHWFTSLQASAKFRFPLHGIKLVPALVGPRKYSFTCAKQSRPLKKYFDTSCVRLNPLILEEKEF